MRLKAKYKVIKQLKNWKNLDTFPKKLVQTNKKSWKAYTSSFTLDKCKNLIVENSNKLIQLVPARRWEFSKKTYKNGLELKRYYYHLFDFAIRNKVIKTNIHLLSKKYKQSLYLGSLLYLVKPYFRADILLWSIGLLNSVYEARNYIFNKKILLNQQIKFHPNYILKSGDLLTFKFFNENLTFKKIMLKKIVCSPQFFFFCEIDFYAKNLIIVNDLTNLRKSYDNPQVFYKKVDIRRFLTYLKSEY